jgi:hypothetical protein
MHSCWQGRLFASATAFILCTFAIGGEGHWHGANAEEPKAATEPASPCAGLDQGACDANSECVWRKADATESEKERKARCQKKPQRSATKTAPA